MFYRSAPSTLQVGSGQQSREQAFKVAIQAQASPPFAAMPQQQTQLPSSQEVHGAMGDVQNFVDALGATQPEESLTESGAGEVAAAAGVHLFVLQWTMCKECVS